MAKIHKMVSKFDIFPVEIIEMNNPNLAENWKKHLMKMSQPIHLP